MSSPENLLVPLPHQVCSSGVLRPVSLDLDSSSTALDGRMCYLSNEEVSPFRETANNSARLVSQDTMTYSHYVRGSIFSVPKSWQVDNGESLVVSVYLFLKTFLRYANKVFHFAYESYDNVGPSRG